MGHLLAQARIERVSGVAEDVVINTFHFLTPGSLSAIDGATEIVAQLQRFYGTAAPPSTLSLGQFFHAGVATTGHTIRVYDMDTPQPRQPILTAPLTFTPSTAAAGGLPSEVALVLSTRAGLVSGEVPSRRRGRIYFGPIGGSAGTIVGPDHRPQQNLVDALANAGKRLMDDGTPLGKPRWAVFSQVLKTAQLDSDGLGVIVQVRVNNAWDTQRRRGADPTANTDRFIAAT